MHQSVSRASRFRIPSLPMMCFPCAEAGMGGLMGKPHPMELRTRVVAYVDEGHGHREAARHFRVSPKFVNDLVKLRRETGLLTPKRQGNGGARH